MKRVLLIGNDSKYLKDALNLHGYITVNVNDGIKALKFLKKNTIDIILLDVTIPNIDEWRILKTIHKSYEYMPVIVLTDVNDEQKMVSGLKAGADDYIIRPFALPNLLARMEAVLRRCFVNEKVKIQKKCSTNCLTQKEREVLELASKGISNKKIADKLSVKEVTIKTHLSSIYKKLKVSNRTQAVLAVGQSGT